MRCFRSSRVRSILRCIVSKIAAGCRRIGAQARTIARQSSTNSQPLDVNSSLPKAANGGRSWEPSGASWARSRAKRGGTRMRWLGFIHRRDKDADLALELEAHLQNETDDYVARGLSQEEAIRRARINFGSTTRIREDLWQRNSVRLEGILRDIAYAGRTLLRSPGFAIMAAAVMALGIGTNTALFTVVNSVLLKPLPFADPDRLVMLYERSVDTNYPYNIIAPGIYAEWQKDAQSFERMAIFGGSSYNLSSDSGQLPERIESVRASADFFSTLGVAPAYGKVFTSADDQPQAEATVVLSWGLWKRRFGGDPSLIGNKILLDGSRYTVIGIMPSWFAYPDAQTQVWTAFHHEIPPKDLIALDNHSFN